MGIGTTSEQNGVRQLPDPFSHFLAFYLLQILVGDRLAMETDNTTCHIPKNILQFWHDKEKIPVEMQEALDGTRATHGDYEIRLADDAEIRALLDARHTRELRAIYDLIRLPSSRSDIARLVLLKEYGGFYLDASMQFHSSLNAFLSGNPMLVLVQRDDMPLYRVFPENAHVMGGIIGAPAGLPFIDRCIERAVDYLQLGVFNTRAWMAAGPGVINATLRLDQTTHPIHKASFKAMRNGMVSHRRSPGISSSWTVRQREGIIDPALYAEGSLAIPLEKPAPWWRRLL